MIELKSTITCPECSFRRSARRRACAALWRLQLAPDLPDDLPLLLKLMQVEPGGPRYIRAHCRPRPAASAADNSSLVIGERAPTAGPFPSLSCCLISIGDAAGAA